MKTETEALREQLAKIVKAYDNAQNKCVIGCSDCVDTNAQINLADEIEAARELLK